MKRKNLWYVGIFLFLCCNLIACDNKGKRKPEGPDNKETKPKNKGKKGNKSSKDGDKNIELPPSSHPSEEPDISSIGSEPSIKGDHLGDYPETGPGGLKQVGKGMTCFNAAGTQLIAFVPGFSAGFFNFEERLKHNKDRLKTLEEKQNRILSFTLSCNA